MVWPNALLRAYWRTYILSLVHDPGRWAVHAVSTACGWHSTTARNSRQVSQLILRYGVLLEINPPFSGHDPKKCAPEAGNSRKRKQRGRWAWNSLACSHGYTSDHAVIPVACPAHVHPLPPLNTTHQSMSILACVSISADGLPLPLARLSFSVPLSLSGCCCMRLMLAAFKPMSKTRARSSCPSPMSWS